MALRRDVTDQASVEAMVAGCRCQRGCAQIASLESGGQGVAAVIERETY